MNKQKMNKSHCSSHNCLSWLLDSYTRAAAFILWAAAFSDAAWQSCCKAAACWENAQAAGCEVLPANLNLKVKLLKPVKAASGGIKWKQK
jgi:hypothetical protein